MYVEPRADELAGFFPLLGLPGSNGHVGAVAREEAGSALTYRAGSREDDDLLSLQVTERLFDFHHCGHGGGVGPVRVEHDRDLERLEQRILRHREELLACRHVAAADPDRRVVKILHAAREDAAVNQIADVRFGHATIAHDDVGAGIIGDDLIEYAGEAGAIELEQELAHRGHYLLSIRGPEKTRGAPTVGRPSRYIGSAGLYDQPSAPLANG